MSAKALEFTRKVAFTTFLSYSVMSFFYLGLYAILMDPTDGSRQPVGVYFRYVLGKLFCIFLFSLALGFLNRLMEQEGKSRALKRLVHVLLTAVVYGFIMCYLFHYLFNAGTANEQFKTQLLVNVIFFVIGYPLTLGMTAFGRAIFLPKEKKITKSILD